MAQAAHPSSSPSPSPTPQRAVLRLVRMRVSTASSSRGTFAAALPCPNYYDVYPNEIGPLGNVEVTDAAELQRWLLVARTVTQEEAEAHGGCIRYSPPPPQPPTPTAPAGASATTSVSSAAEKAVGHSGVQYYCITDPDDVVYGRAAYLPHPPPPSCRATGGSEVPSGRYVGSCSSEDGYTEEDSSATPRSVEKDEQL